MAWWIIDHLSIAASPIRPPHGFPLKTLTEFQEALKHGPYGAHWTYIWSENSKSGLWSESTICSEFLHNSQSMYERLVMQTGFPDGPGPWGIQQCESLRENPIPSLAGIGQACDVEKLTSSQMKSTRLGCTDKQPLLMTRSSPARATWIPAFTASCHCWPFPSLCGSFKIQASFIHGEIWMQKRCERSVPIFSGFYKVDKLLKGSRLSQ